MSLLAAQILAAKSDIVVPLVVLWIVCLTVIRRQGGLIQSAENVRRMDDQIDRSLSFAPVEAGGVPLHAVVTVQGTVQPGPGGLLTSPREGEPCVWWGHAKGDAHQQQSSSELFYIEDPRGRIGVQPEGIYVDCRSVEQQRDDDGGPDDGNSLDDEWVLRPGQRVRALAPVGQDRDGQRFLEALRHEPGTIVLDDDPKAFRQSRAKRVWALVGLFVLPLLIVARFVLPALWS